MRNNYEDNQRDISPIKETKTLQQVTANPLETLRKMMADSGGLQALLAADIFRDEDGNFRVFITYTKEG